MKNTNATESFYDKEDELMQIDENDMVTFEEFRKLMMEEEYVSVRLRRACQQQLRQGNNMKNLTSRHSEYIAVKVALGVLVLLFVLGLVERDVLYLDLEKKVYCNELIHGGRTCEPGVTASIQ